MSARATLVTTATSALAVALSAGGCRQIVGIEGDPRYEGPPQACGGMAYASPDCSACMRASCCAAAESCAAGAACGPFAGCVAACAPADVACASGCRARGAAGDGAEAAALETCEAVHCASACQVACGGYVYPDADCAACGNANCCDASAACMRDSECTALTACERACAPGDDGCLELCELAHPSGVTSERAFGACLHASCPAACVAPEWACLRHAVTPPPLQGGPAISITYRIVDYATLQPIAGLAVRACGRTDLDCATSLVAPVSTDALGEAVLRLGFNEFEGYTEISGPGYITALVYFPLLRKDFITPVFPLIQQSTAAALIRGVVGGPPPMDTGTLFVRVADCAASPAGGVRLAIEPSDTSTRFYFADRIPSVTATETDGTAFSVGGFANVRANAAITVHATVADNGLAYAPVDVPVRPGPTSATILFLYAAPP